MLLSVCEFCGNQVREGSAKFSQGRTWKYIYNPPWKSYIYIKKFTYFKTAHLYAAINCSISLYVSMYELSTLAKNLLKILANFFRKPLKFWPDFSPIWIHLTLVLVRFLIESNNQRTKLYYFNRFRSKILMWRETYLKIKPYCRLKKRRMEKTKAIESFSVPILFWPTVVKRSFLIRDAVIDIF
jgi:hypothetical protein